MDEWDKEFYNMLALAAEVEARWVLKWCENDYFRLESLASAMANDKIVYRMRAGGMDWQENNVLMPDWEVSNATGLQRTEQVKECLLDRNDTYKFEFNSSSLLAWLNKAYPLEPEQLPASEHPFMSDQLARAVQFSNELYPDGYTDTGESPKVQKDNESARIKKHLKNKNLSTRVREALTVQLNPVK